jgi:hypothetical protein
VTRRTPFEVALLSGARFVRRLNDAATTRPLVEVENERAAIAALDLTDESRAIYSIELDIIRDELLASVAGHVLERRPLGVA